MTAPSHRSTIIPYLAPQKVQVSLLALFGSIGLQLLGLLPLEGEIRWNDEKVRDPASFLVPPRSGYTPQVPRLFSEPLEDNGAGAGARDRIPR